MVGVDYTDAQRLKVEQLRNANGMHNVTYLKPAGCFALADIVTEVQLPAVIIRNSTLWAWCIGSAMQQAPEPFSRLDRRDPSGLLFIHWLSPIFSICVMRPQLPRRVPPPDSASC